MVNAQRIGKKITRMFNFVYEINGKYYAMGRDIFEACEKGTERYYYYEGYLDSLLYGKMGRILYQYERVRVFTKCARSKSAERDNEIVEFVKSLGTKELEALCRQVELALEYDDRAYNIRY